jgi:hypothetical protein
VLLLKSDVLDARVRERPISLPSSMTARFLLEPEDDVPEEFRCDLRLDQEILQTGL